MAACRPTAADHPADAVRERPSRARRPARPTSTARPLGWRPAVRSGGPGVAALVGAAAGGRRGPRSATRRGPGSPEEYGPPWSHRNGGRACTPPRAAPCDNRRLSRVGSHDTSADASATRPAPYASPAWNAGRDRDALLPLTNELIAGVLDGHGYAVRRQDARRRPRRPLGRQPHLLLPARPATARSCQVRTLVSRGLRDRRRAAARTTFCNALEPGQAVAEGVRARQRRRHASACCGEVVADLEHGVTTDQLDQCVACGIAAGCQCADGARTASPALKPLQRWPKSGRARASGGGQRTGVGARRRRFGGPGRARRTCRSSAWRGSAGDPAARRGLGGAGSTASALSSRRRAPAPPVVTSVRLFVARISLTGWKNVAPPTVQSPEPPEVTPWAWSPESHGPPESPPSAQTLVPGQAGDRALGVVHRLVLRQDHAAEGAGGRGRTGEWPATGASV